MIKMLDSPSTLREFCLERLRETMSGACEESGKQDEGKTAFKFKEFGLTPVLSEELLTLLSENEQLTDEIMAMFDSNATRLKKVKIPNASKLSLKGLRVLKKHHITDLEVIGLTKITINELIGCLGEWSLYHLRNLNVASSSFTSNNKFCVIVGLAKLQQLQVLDVSHTEFNYHGLEIVAEDLPCLHSLNISATRVRDISPLKKCKNRLKWLSMYNLRSVSGGCQEFVPILCELKNLVHLDISDDRENPLDMLTPLQDSTSELLQRPECFVNLKSLDLSGREGIDSDQLKRFIIYKRNLGKEYSLRFLGLMQTQLCSEEILISESHPYYSKDLIVTGNSTECQILESLRRYYSRASFVQKSLYHLYSHTLVYTEPRVVVIQLILIAMKRHSKMIGIQMASTACLYNLTKGKLSEKIHPKWLKGVVDLTLDAMENFPTNQQLQKNTLLTLCSDRILQDVTFDKFKCTKLVMDSLVSFHETAMNRMAVAICSILAAKISTSETSCLGAKPIYMETLLEIVNNRLISSHEPDIMLKFTLSALWNLTDESPNTCSMFLEKGGMKLYLQVLDMFTGQSTIETKVLGLLNNVAEVDQLRKYLMDNRFLIFLRSLMYSFHIDVSYFAAGIFAHLISDPKCWLESEVDLKSVLSDLEIVVLSWKTPDIEMVAYRSFTPFLPLLKCFDYYQVQLWAVWAIHHVCSKNPKRYCEMLIEEKGIESIQEIIKSPIATTNESLINLCEKTIEVVREEFPNFKT